jgi:hypothetical protein
MTSKESEQKKQSKIVQVNSGPPSTYVFNRSETQTSRDRLLKMGRQKVIVY